MRFFGNANSNNNFQMIAFILGVLFLTQLSGILAQTGNPVVDAGINAGKELASGIAAMNFASTMGKLLTNGSPFFGMIGPVIDMLGLLTGLRQESAEMKFLREMLSTIENRFDRINGRLDELAEKIDWTRSQIQFYTYERRILALESKLKNIYFARSEQELVSFKDSFANEYESTYQQSGLLLFKHIVQSEFVFARNVLAEAIKGNNYNRRDVQNFMLGLTKLMLVASQIELAYHKIKYPSTLYTVKNTWTSRILDMRKAMEDADQQIVDSFFDIAMNDAKEILMYNKGQSHSYVGDKIYEHLAEKFYWRNWLVVVYDDIRHNENHQINYCTSSGSYVFRFYGFNFLLGSSDENTPSFDYYTARNRLYSADIIDRSWWGRGIRGAKSILEDISFDCYHFQYLGVIKSSADPYIRATWGRSVNILRFPYRMFLFG